MKSKIIFFGGFLALILLFKFAVNNAYLHNEPEMETSPVSFTNLTAEESLNLLQTNDSVFLLDVHVPEQKHLSQTDAFIPFDQIADRSDQLPDNKSTPLLVYCKSGTMSLKASEDLINLGFTNVYNLSGGIYAWQKTGLPIDWNQVIN